jgi:hypothetical protein
MMPSPDLSRGTWNLLILKLPRLALSTVRRLRNRFNTHFGMWFHFRKLVLSSIRLPREARRLAAGLDGGGNRMGGQFYRLHRRDGAQLELRTASYQRSSEAVGLGRKMFEGGA